jgi:hypothetical protein
MAAGPGSPSVRPEDLTRSGSGRGGAGRIRIGAGVGGGSGPLLALVGKVAVAGGVDVGVREGRTTGGGGAVRCVASGTGGATGAVGRDGVGRSSLLVGAAAARLGDADGRAAGFSGSAIFTPV